MPLPMDQTNTTANELYMSLPIQTVSGDSLTTSYLKSPILGTSMYQNHDRNKPETIKAFSVLFNVIKTHHMEEQ